MGAVTLHALRHAGVRVDSSAVQLTGGLVEPVDLAGSKAVHGAPGSPEFLGTGEAVLQPTIAGTDAGARPATSDTAAANGARTTSASGSGGSGFSLGFPSPFGHITISAAGIHRSGSTSLLALGAGAGILLAALYAIRRSSGDSPDAVADDA